MKLSEKMRQVTQHQDAYEAGKVADFCRFKLGWNHPKMLAEWSRVTGAEPADIDGLLYEADELESSMGN